MRKKIDFESLIQDAGQAAMNAYAPYSLYNVGAAILCGNDRVITACNVENISYGLSICAERNAINAAISSGTKEFKAIAIVASSGNKKNSMANIHPYPCGACRQVLAEFCTEDFPVVTANADNLDQYRVTTLGELLPKAFTTN